MKRLPKDVGPGDAIYFVMNGYVRAVADVIDVEDDKIIFYCIKKIKFPKEMKGFQGFRYKKDLL